RRLFSSLSNPFCLPMLNSHSSPLFPYTTLFRSRLRVQPDPAPHRSALSELAAPAGAPEHGPGRHLHGQLLAGARGLAERLPLHPDRKSTRLNSSHVKISYAVFCLKKKTNKSNYP